MHHRANGSGVIEEQFDHAAADTADASARTGNQIHG
jgi:hypothetical protein